MNSVDQAEETLDIGVCHEHNRVFQCYCTQCYCMICPSCLMFDSHRGHQVSRIEEGVKDLRQRINSAAKEGILKFDKTENVLLDIRHIRLSVQENQQNILKTAQKMFQELIATIKGRKAQFLMEIKKHYEEQMKTIEDTESDWQRKQELSQRILSYQTSNDDIKIVEEAKKIVEGLQDLKRPMQYRQIQLVESIKTEGQLNKNVLSFVQMRQLLKTCMKKGNPIINKLKC